MGDAEIQACLSELVRLQLRSSDSAPPGLMPRLLRLLRPMGPAEEYDAHMNAMKQRLRGAIISHALDRAPAGEEGPLLVARFDKEVDRLRRLRSPHLAPFLAIASSLSFSKDSSVNPALNPRIISMSDQSKTVPESRWVDIAEAKASDPGLMFAQQRRGGANFTQLDGLVWVDPDTEAKLLKDLLFVFQGISGAHIKYSLRAEAYIIDPSLHVPTSARDLVLCMCELGWLYNKIEKFITKVEKTAINGLVSQAFGYAIQEELHDYYRLLAVLERELTRLPATSATPASAAVSVAAAAGANELRGNGTAQSRIDEEKRDIELSTALGGLSLVRLKAWLQGPIDRMCLIARLVDGALPLQGGALISRAYGFALNGDPASVALVKRMMVSVCHPMYAVLHRWIVHGELIDAHKEFFVGINQDVSINGGNLWHDLYFIRYSMLPRFLSQELAQKILVIGKSINFLRACDHTGAWDKETWKGSKKSRQLSLKQTPASSATEDATADESMRELDAALKTIKFGDEAKLEEIVSRIAVHTDAKLLKVMMEKAHLSEHLQALKKFMLLGQGDFVICLMDAVGVELKKRATQLYRHNLTGILEGALRGSNAQFEPSYVLDKITVRLLEPSPGDTGWEIFSLDYAVDAPLTALIHPDAIATYRTAFHMLWRLKRVEWSLSAAWKAQMAIGHLFGREAMRKLRGVLHRCALHRNRMRHFVNNLSAYLMFEVMESAWSGLEERMAQASSLDEVIDAHDRYLDDIQDRALLSVHHEALNIEIQRVLQAILRFCQLEETLIADAHSSLSRKQAVDRTAADQSALGGWGSTAPLDTTTESPGSIDGVSSHVINRLEEAASNYDVQYAALLKLLREKSDQAGGMVRFLTFRLDYNAEELQRAAAVAEGMSTTTQGVGKAPGPTMYGPDGRKLSSPNSSTATVANTSFASTRGVPSSRGGAPEPSSRRSLASEFASSSATADGAPPSRQPPSRFSTSMK